MHAIAPLHNRNDIFAWPPLTHCSASTTSPSRPPVQALALVRSAENGGSDARQHEIADSLSKLIRQELKRGTTGTNRIGQKRTGTERARNGNRAS
jgi:hypothetical protein